MERRNALRRKILGKYGSLTAFCKDINYSRTQISNILCCKEPGGIGFWKKVKEKLGLTSEEIINYIFDDNNKEKENEK